MFTELAKTLSDAVQTGHRTPLTNSPSPIVARPLKIAELKFKYIQEMKDLVSLYELGALSQEDFD